MASAVSEEQLEFLRRFGRILRNLPLLRKGSPKAPAVAEGLSRFGATIENSLSPFPRTKMMNPSCYFGEFIRMASAVSGDRAESFRRFGWFCSMAPADFVKEKLSPPFGKVGRLTPAVAEGFSEIFQNVLGKN